MDRLEAENKPGRTDEERAVQNWRYDGPTIQWTYVDDKDNRPDTILNILAWISAQTDILEAGPH